MSKTIYTKEYKLFIKKLKEARLKSGLTQQEIAKKLNKPQSYISKSESRERRLDIVELKKFADIYKQDIKIFIN